MTKFVLLLLYAIFYWGFANLCNLKILRFKLTSLYIFIWITIQTTGNFYKFKKQFLEYFIKKLMQFTKLTFI